MVHVPLGGAKQSILRNLLAAGSVGAVAES